MKRYKPLFEARSHPELNPHVGAWDYLEKYQDDKDVYISFTAIDKIGINPQSHYNTPVGIYCYPLSEFYKNYIGTGNNIKQTQVSIGTFAPFAGNSQYINFIRVKDKSHFVNDMYTDYGSNDYDRDIKILRNLYSILVLESSEKLKKFIHIFIRELKSYNLDNIDLKEVQSITRSVNVHEFSGAFNKLLTIRISSETFSLFIKYKSLEKITDQEIFDRVSPSNNLLTPIILEGLETAKEHNPIMSMWNITRLLSEKLSSNKKQAATKWNLILSKDLGYSGFADKSGKGYIHPSEPMQAVFLNTRAFELIARLENKPAKTDRKPKFIGDQLKNLLKVGQKFDADSYDEIWEITKMSPFKIILNTISKGHGGSNSTMELTTSLIMNKLQNKELVPIK